MTAKQYNVIVDFIHTYEWKNNELMVSISYKDFANFISAFKLGKRKVNTYITTNNILIPKFKNFLMEFTDMCEEEVLILFPVEELSENNE